MASDDDHRLAEVGLGVPGRVCQQHEHLAAATFALTHVILHDRVAAGEPVLIAKPLEHPLRRVPLLAMNLAITLQPAIDDPGEPIQLRPFHRCRSAISGRNRIRHHLPDAVARDVEMPRGLSLAHALSTRAPNLPIQIPPLMVCKQTTAGQRVKILPPSLSPERAKVDDSYAARSGLIPPLPWPTFAPPFSVTSSCASDFGRWT